MSGVLGKLALYTLVLRLFTTGKYIMNGNKIERYKYDHAPPSASVLVGPVETVERDLAEVFEDDNISPFCPEDHWNSYYKCGSTQLLKAGQVSM